MIAQPCPSDVLMIRKRNKLFTTLKREFFDENDPEKDKCGKYSQRRTYADGELIFQPLQVEVEVRLGHLLLTPAAKFGENSRCHVDDETVRPVE